MIRPWLTVLIAVAMLATLRSRPVYAAAAEVKLDKEYLAGLVEKLPPLPFQNPGKVRGTAYGYRLAAIDPNGRRFVVGCLVEGEYRPPISGPLARRDDDGTWRKFRFEVHLSINVEPGGDGTPRFKISVDEVRRKEIEGLAGTLAKLLGKYFDDIATRLAAGKANQLSGKLNAEIVKRIAAFKEYGVFTGIDYTPALVVLHFEMTRFKPEGIAGYVYATGAAEGPPPGTVPLFRAVHRKLGAHFYTIHREEAALRGFQIEGIACHVFDRPFQQTVALYRWGVPRDGFYTTARDGEGCARRGYRLEGIACFLYSEASPGTVPFYRFVDPRTGRHFYTVHPNAEFARAGSGSGPAGRPIAMIQAILDPCAGHPGVEHDVPKCVPGGGQIRGEVRRPHDRGQYRQLDQRARSGRPDGPGEGQQAGRHRRRDRQGGLDSEEPRAVCPVLPEGRPEPAGQAGQLG
jgi:hypothetical protein